MTNPTATTKFDHACADFQRGERKAAFGAWHDLEAEGFAPASWCLGVLSCIGGLDDGDNPDLEGAVQHLRKAAAAGHPWAQAELGFMYHFGHGVEKDERAARAWFHLAAELGDDDGQISLAWCCENGLGGEQDLARISQMNP